KTERVIKLIVRLKNRFLAEHARGADVKPRCDHADLRLTDVDRVLANDFGIRVVLLKLLDGLLEQTFARRCIAAERHGLADGGADGAEPPVLFRERVLGDVVPADAALGELRVGGRAEGDAGTFAFEKLAEQFIALRVGTALENRK